MKAVVKIGGSLIEEAPEIVKKLLEQFDQSCGKNSEEGLSDEKLTEESFLKETFLKETSSKEEEEEEKEVSVLIVPGGGPFADSVRVADEKFGIGAEASHWMAVLSMEQYAYYLMEKSGV